MSSEVQCLVAEFASIEDADIACQVLETADFDDQTVSIVTRHNEQTVSDGGTLMGDASDSPPAGKSAAVGGAIGGSLGTALGTATLIGPFMVVGPLVGIALGAGTAGVLAAADRWGLEKDRTVEYERRVKNGSVLLIVADDELRLNKAERLLKTTGPKSMERFERS